MSVCVQRRYGRSPRFSTRFFTDKDADRALADVLEEPLDPDGLPATPDMMDSSESAPAPQAVAIVAARRGGRGAAASMPVVPDEVEEWDSD